MAEKMPEFIIILQPNSSKLFNFDLNLTLKFTNIFLWYDQLSSQINVLSNLYWGFIMFPVFILDIIN